jgi:hypothetical protein
MVHWLPIRRRSIHFALQAGVAHRRSTTTSFRYLSVYRSVPLGFSMLYVSLVLGHHLKKMLW